MNADELDRALNRLAPGATQPRSPTPAAQLPSAGQAAAALACGLRLVGPTPAAADLEQRERRVREQLAARRDLEPRIRHPKLFAALRKLDTRCALLLGPTGAGKTSAARWARVRHSGLWVAARALGACERKHPLGEGDPQLMRDAIATPVLYLDDLGSEEPRDVGVLQHVIDQRYGAEPPRATFVTSALTQSALSAYLGTPYLRRLGEQHVRKPDGSEWPVLFVDCHEAKP